MLTMTRSVCFFFFYSLSIEWTQSNLQQTIEQLQTPTMGVTINKKVNNNRTTAFERTAA